MPVLHSKPAARARGCRFSPLSAKLVRMSPPHTVDSLERLQSLFGPVGDASIRKEVSVLHPVYQRWSAQSPFAVLATSGPGGLDASPRGDPAGFAVVHDERTLLLPERRGNNRIDSLRNIIGNPHVALLFLIPGIGETLRVNGRARVLAGPAVLAPFAVGGRPPTCVVRAGGRWRGGGPSRGRP